MPFAMRVLVLLTFVSVTSSHAQTTAPTKFQLSAQEKQLLELTNAERKKERLPPLRPDPQLFAVARAHSANMARQEKMNHDLDGKTPFERIKGTGYLYQFAGENIAAGDVPMELVMEAWMKSEGHRKNILDERYTRIGLGVVRNAKGDLYYTQVFAKPR